jgi:hypothetical protein
MMDKWQKIFSSQNMAKASIIKGMLEENNVPVMLINKQGSSLINFGEIELHVPSLFKEIATQLIDPAVRN